MLRDFGREDWQLSATVCKMLCNYCTRMTSAADTFGHAEAQQLSDLLVEYLGKLVSARCQLAEVNVTWLVSVDLAYVVISFQNGLQVHVPCKSFFLLQVKSVIFQFSILYTNPTFTNS